jgi:hypothetical protein
MKQKTKLTPMKTSHQKQMDEYLIRLVGVYGFNNTEEVIGYLVQRGIDDLIRCGVLK